MFLVSRLECFEFFIKNFFFNISWCYPLFSSLNLICPFQKNLTIHFLFNKKKSTVIERYCIFWNFVVNQLYSIKYKCIIQGCKNIYNIKYSIPICINYRLSFFKNLLIFVKTVLNWLKELSLWHNIKFSNPFISATWWWRPLIEQNS